MELTPTAQLPRNAFQCVMTGLSIIGTEPDIFSEACVAAWETHDCSRLGYPFTQVFEPNVLAEIARLEGLDHSALATLDHRPTIAIRGLADQLGSACRLSHVERINLASVLVSISRMELAAALVSESALPSGSPRVRFELAWLRFLISNRAEDGRGSASAFDVMQDAATTGKLPPGRVLDACTQGVVWYIKRREISAETYRWCVETGSAIIRAGSDIDAGSRSAWFRGVAMVPAAVRDAVRTRRLMEFAHDSAEREGGDGTRPGQRNAIKTYYESALKEHLYVTPDRQAAEAFGQKLIALDPHWSPSYGELGDVHRHFGDMPQAGRLYLAAADNGPPYLCHHLLQAARCFRAGGDHQRAMEIFYRLAAIAPDVEVVAREGNEMMLLCSVEEAGRYADTLETNRGSLGKPRALDAVG